MQRPDFKELYAKREAMKSRSDATNGVSKSGVSFMGIGDLVENPYSAFHTVYISPQGDDTTGNGSEEQPWQTLAYAASQIDGIAGQRAIVCDGGVYPTVDVTADVNLQTDDEFVISLMQSATENAVFTGTDEYDRPDFNGPILDIQLSGVNEVPGAVHILGHENGSKLVFSGTDIHEAVTVEINGILNIENVDFGAGESGLYCNTLKNDKNFTITVNNCRFGTHTGSSAHFVSTQNSVNTLKTIVSITNCQFYGENASLSNGVHLENPNGIACLGGALENCSFYHHYTALTGKSVAMSAVNVLFHEHTIGIDIDVSLCTPNQCEFSGTINPQKDMVCGIGIGVDREWVDCYFHSSASTCIELINDTNDGVSGDGLSVNIRRFRFNGENKTSGYVIDNSVDHDDNNWTVLLDSCLFDGFDHHPVEFGGFLDSATLQLIGDNITIGEGRYGLHLSRTDQLISFRNLVVQGSEYCLLATNGVNAFDDFSFSHCAFIGDTSSDSGSVADVSPYDPTNFQRSTWAEAGIYPYPPEPLYLPLEDGDCTGTGTSDSTATIAYNDLSWGTLYDRGAFSEDPYWAHDGPYVTVPDDEITYNDEAYTRQIQSLVDFDLNFELISPPSGMSINGSSGLITWANPAVRSTSYLIQVLISGFRFSHTISWYLTVLCPPEEEPYGTADEYPCETTAYASVSFSVTSACGSNDQDWDFTMAEGMGCSFYLAEYTSYIEFVSGLSISDTINELSFMLRCRKQSADPELAIYAIEREITSAERTSILNGNSFTITDCTVVCGNTIVERISVTIQLVDYFSNNRPCQAADPYSPIYLDCDPYIDILFLVDKSPTMLPYIDAVEEEILSVASRLGGADVGWRAGLDDPYSPLTPVGNPDIRFSLVYFGYPKRPLWVPPPGPFETWPKYLCDFIENPYWAWDPYWEPYGYSWEEWAPCVGVDFVFAIDFSGSMGTEINAVRQNVQILADRLTDAFIDLKVGFVRFGSHADAGNCPTVRLQPTRDLNQFRLALQEVSARGGYEPVPITVQHACDYINWRNGSARYVFVITDETQQQQGNGGKCGYSDNLPDPAIEKANASSVTVLCAITSSAAREGVYTRISEETGWTAGHYEVTGPYDLLFEVLSHELIDRYYSGCGITHNWEEESPVPPERGRIVCDEIWPPPGIDWEQYMSYLKCEVTMTDDVRDTIQESYCDFCTGATDVPATFYVSQRCPCSVWEMEQWWCNSAISTGGRWYDFLLKFGPTQETATVCKWGYTTRTHAADELWIGELVCIISLNKNTRNLTFEFRHAYAGCPDDPCGVDCDVPWGSLHSSQTNVLGLDDYNTLISGGTIYEDYTFNCYFDSCNPGAFEHKGWNPDWFMCPSNYTIDLTVTVALGGSFTISDILNLYVETYAVDAIAPYVPTSEHTAAGFTTDIGVLEAASNWLPLSSDLYEPLGFLCYEPPYVAIQWVLSNSTYQERVPAIDHDVYAQPHDDPYVSRSYNSGVISFGSFLVCAGRCVSPPVCDPPYHPFSCPCAQEHLCCSPITNFDYVMRVVSFMGAQVYYTREAPLYNAAWYESGMVSPPCSIKVFRGQQVVNFDRRTRIKAWVMVHDSGREISLDFRIYSTPEWYPDQEDEDALEALVNNDEAACPPFAWIDDPINYSRSSAKIWVKFARASINGQTSFTVPDVPIMHYNREGSIQSPTDIDFQLHAAWYNYNPPDSNPNEPPADLKTTPQTGESSIPNIVWREEANKYIVLVTDERASNQEWIEDNLNPICAAFCNDQMSALTAIRTLGAKVILAAPPSVSNDYCILSEQSGWWQGYLPIDGPWNLTCEEPYVSGIQITAIPDRLARVGRSYYELIEPYNNTDTAAFSLVDGPDGMEINTSYGYVSWDVPVAPLGERHSVTVRASDSVSSDTETWSVTLGVEPLINDVDNQTVEFHNDYLFKCTLCHGTTPVRWSLVSGPIGMSIGSTSGVIRWENPELTKPLQSSSLPEPYLITVMAENGLGRHDVSWYLNVYEDPYWEPYLELPYRYNIVYAPVIDPMANDCASIYETYIRRPRLLQGTLPITWTLVTGPSGMAIDSSSGRIRWANPWPIDATYTVTVNASNDYGNDTESFVLTIGLAPLINLIEDTTESVGSTYTELPSLCHGTTPVTWSLVEGPVGMTINPVTGLVSWTVRSSSEPVEITIRADNGCGVDEMSWFLTSYYEPYAVPTCDRRLVCVSPEYDSGFDSSIVSRFRVRFTKHDASETVEISFRASDIPNDPSANSQWTSWAEIPESDILYSPSDVGLSSPTGRYKQVRLRFTYCDVVPTVTLVYVLTTAGTTCLDPGETSEAYLDLTPQMRVTQTSHTQLALPLSMERNMTYFTSVSLIDTSGNEVPMPTQFVSASATPSVPVARSWDNSSGSITVNITNASSSMVGYDVSVSIYADYGMTRLVKRYNATHGDSDLSFFTVDDGNEATTSWTASGLLINPSVTSSVALWPEIQDNPPGILCGIPYWVETIYTDLTTNARTRRVKQWQCDCQSQRWDGSMENAATPLSENYRWRSSGFGMTDTRITETREDNVNPKLRLRDIMEGVLVYESTRNKTTLNNNYLYASLFKVFPHPGDAASGMQNIASSQNFALTDANLGSSQKGHNLDLELDWINNLALAHEQCASDDTCDEFEYGKQRTILIHRGGAESLAEESESVEDECSQDTILGTTATDTTKDSSIVAHVIVNANYVRYHIWSDSDSCAIVDQRSIEFDVLAYPGTDSIRFRNETGSWSDWYHFEPEIFNELATSLPWTLTTGSGTKTVTVQVATQAGLISLGDVCIIADYSQVPFRVNFYKSTADMPLPGSSSGDPDPTDDTYFNSTNLVPEDNGVPVASIRAPSVTGEEGSREVTWHQSDFIFVEIIPDTSYINKLRNAVGSSEIQNNTPTFDFLQQGSQDYLGRTTVWDSTKEAFRGYVQIDKEDNILAVDGLALIVPHFLYDDTETGTTSTSIEDAYVMDQYNRMDITISTTSDDIAEDSASRDSVGLLKHRERVRPSEDPYFVFGDPNFKLRQNE